MSGGLAAGTLTPVRAASTSAAVGRRAASLSNIARMRLSSDVAISGLDCDGGAGVSAMMACNVPRNESAAKGCRPVAI